MQEEVEKKSVNLAVTTSKVSGRVLLKALHAYADHLKRKKANKESIQEEPIKGEQTVKELIGQGQGVSTMDIGDSGIRDFKKLANKYGVDFAIVKDKGKPPKYTCFFKAKDADALLKVMDEYTKKQVKKQKKKERPSVLSKLKKFKDIVAKMPRKEKEKKKEQER